MIRLDRWLALLALGSRSKVQPMIRAGRVSVDGAVRRDPGFLCREDARLALDGEVLDSRLDRHLLLYKPAGLLTAARDPRQPTVMSLLPPCMATLGCMPVGRLDKDTTGLLLLTTDGELAHRLLSPARHVEKVYFAETDGPVTAAHAEAFARGLALSDFIALPARLEPAGHHSARVTVREGKFHQVKRMFEAVGLTVTRLHRERFGPLTLPEGMAPGEWRELTEAELSALRRAAGEPEEGPA